MEAVLSLLHTATLAIIGFFIALGSFFGPHLVATAPPAPAATSTLPAASATSTANFPTATSSAPTKVSAQKPPDILPEAQSAPAKQTTVPQPLTTHSTEELNALARAPLVNILCTTQSGGSFNPISASGVFIDSRGIILTNAHVGQYFLLRNYLVPNNVQCVIRTGSPAQPRYTAELLYLPPAWIAANAKKIASSSPTGNGENDYAFLRVTGTTNPQATPPSSFPSIAMDGAEPDSGDTMVLAAYPAGFLGGISIALNLYTSSAVATVGTLYSFDDSGLVDLFSLGGTIVSQSGSSGGAAVNQAGKLNGLIVTEVPADTTAGRDLRALTIAHINRSLVASGQGGIVTLLSHDPAAFAAEFNTKIAPAETKALEDALK